MPNVQCTKHGRSDSITAKKNLSIEKAKEYTHKMNKVARDNGSEVIYFIA